MAVKNINDQPVKTPTYLWGVDEVGLACRATPYVSPVLSVVGLTGEITQAGLRAALGLGTAAYINVASTGNASVDEIVKGNDTRLSDARTPVAHTHTAANISDSTVTGRAVLTATDQTAARTAIGAGTSSTYNVAVSGNAAPGEVVKGNDTRLSDARTPVAHTHVAANISDSTVTGRAVLTATDQAAARTAIGAGTSSTYNVAASGNAASGEVVKGNDSRLSDARTPTAHNQTASTISDSTPVGRSVLTATDAATARSAIGAAPTDSPTFTTNISTPAVNGAALGPKNKLFNGCMRISSPNGASGAAVLGQNTVGAAGVTTIVGGFATFSGAIYQVGGIQDARTSSGAMHYLAFGATTGGSGNVVYKMNISAEDALAMAGKPVTVSCRLMAAGTTPTTSWLRRYKADSYNDFSATTWLGDGPKSNTAAMSVPLDLEYTFTPTYADCINGMQVDVALEYTGANGSPQNPSYVSIANFQVIEGSKRLPFEARPLEQERQLYENSILAYKGKTPSDSGFGNAILNGSCRVPARLNVPIGIGSLVQDAGAAGFITEVGGWATVDAGARVNWNELLVDDARGTGGSHYVHLSTTPPTGATGWVRFQRFIVAEDAKRLTGLPQVLSARLLAWATAPVNTTLRVYKPAALDDQFGARTLIRTRDFGGLVIGNAKDCGLSMTLNSSECQNGLVVDAVLWFSGAIAANTVAFISNFQLRQGLTIKEPEFLPLELEKALVNRFKPTAPSNLTANTTLASNAKYSYSAGALTLTLPAAPANGDEVVIYNTGSLLTTVVGRNGKTIMGLAQDMTLDIANKKYVFEYLSATGDWRIGA